MSERGGGLECRDADLDDAAACEREVLERIAPGPDVTMNTPTFPLARA